jgi:hypothetical protein
MKRFIVNLAVWHGDIRTNHEVVITQPRSKPASRWRGGRYGRRVGPGCLAALGIAVVATQTENDAVQNMVCWRAMR